MTTSFWVMPVQSTAVAPTPVPEEPLLRLIPGVAAPSLRASFVNRHTRNEGAWTLIDSFGMIRRLFRKAIQQGRSE